MADEARELSRKRHDWRLLVAAANCQAAAVVKKLIASNPAEGCALPKAEHQEMKTLTAEQLSSFLREAKESEVLEMYYVELATGLRRGELLGKRQNAF